VNAVGEVESVDQVTLSSEVSGVVQFIYADIGDSVVAGQSLVKFESSTYDAQLAQAAASIDRAQASLDQVLAGATEEEIAQSAASVSQAQANLTSAEVAYEQAVLAAEQSIDDAEAALATAENNLRTAEDGESSLLVEAEYDDLVATIKASFTTVTDVMEDSDEILGIESPGVNDAFEDILSALDTQSLVNAENSYQSLKRERNDHLDGVQALDSESTLDEILLYTDRAKDILATAEDHIYYMIDVMNATPDSANLSASQINTYVGTFTTNLTTVQTRVAALDDDAFAINTAENTYSNALITYESEVADYEQALLAAEQSVAAAEATVQIREAALQAAQAAYDIVIADPRSVDLASLEAGVAEAYASYQLAAANQGKSILSAPISGQIAVMNAREGDLLSAGSEVVSIVNVNQLQVTAYISSEDLKWIRLGDTVLVNESIEAEVYRVSPSINPSTKKVEIKVLITAEDADVTVGQYVQIEVQSSLVEEENTQYFLPLAAVKAGTEKNYVYVVNEQGLIDQQEIELGQILGESIEVLSGLSADDQFVSSVRGLSVGDAVSVLNAE
jgi:RND family efflux transporter MFP subunit